MAGYWLLVSTLMLVTDSAATCAKVRLATCELVKAVSLGACSARPVARAPSEVTKSFMPDEIVELRSTLERTVVTLRSPATVPLSAKPVLSPVIAAVLRVDISILRPSPAFRDTPPVRVSATAITPVLLVWALMAAAI